jgi:hypothetical protein
MRGHDIALHFPISERVALPCIARLRLSYPVVFDAGFPSLDALRLVRELFSQVTVWLSQENVASE